MNRMHASLLAAAISLVGAALACSSPDASGTVSPGGPDPASFTPVAKVLVQRCGSIDCHGSHYRNMRLYGFGSQRLDPTNLPDSPSDITRDEVAADYAAVVGLEPTVMHDVVAEGGRNPSRLTFVRKARGQEAHKGGKQIERGDAADGCILSWLASDVDEDSCAAALR